MGADHRLTPTARGPRRLVLPAAVLFALASVAGLPACKDKPPPSPSKAVTTATPPRADRLAAGEIPEGRERAFGLPLPLHSAIKARFPTSIHVASVHTREELANFTRSRIKEGSTSVGASETRFESVIVPAEPSRRVTVEIRSAAFGDEYRSQMVVSDVTPTPDDPSLTPEERWKKAGMTPDGKLLDPKHMQ